jgi:hypothetical protein
MTKIIGEVQADNDWEYRRDLWIEFYKYVYRLRFSSLISEDECKEFIKFIEKKMNISNIDIPQPSS